MHLQYKIHIVSKKIIMSLNYPILKLWLGTFSTPCIYISIWRERENDKKRKTIEKNI